MVKKKTSDDYESDNEIDEQVDDESVTAESATEISEEKIEEGFEKISKTLSDVQNFGNETMQAYVESAAIAGKALESINKDFYAYFQKSLDDSMAATKAIWTSKSVHEAFEHQVDFAKSALEAHKEQMEKLREGLTVAGKDSLVPLKGRAQAMAEVMQSARAA